MKKRQVIIHDVSDFEKSRDMIKRIERRPELFNESNYLFSELTVKEGRELFQYMYIYITENKLTDDFIRYFNKRNSNG